MFTTDLPEKKKKEKKIYIYESTLKSYTLKNWKI